MGRWVKGTFDSVEALSAYIDTSIDSIMQNEIAKGLKKAVKKKVEENVYSYPAEFMSRDYGYGGMLDESFMYTYYTRPELTLEHIVAPQNRGFKYIDGRGAYDFDGNIAEIIEKRQVYNAPPRPYLEEAGDTYGAENADKDMQKGLTKAGL